MNESCPIFFIFWQCSLTCATLILKEPGLWITSKNVTWHSKPSPVPTHLSTSTGNLCNHYLCWLHPPGYQQRKPRLTEGLNVTAQKGLRLLATFFRFPSPPLTSLWSAKTEHALPWAFGPRLYTPSVDGHNLVLRHKAWEAHSSNRITKI